jgi:hypothetical protein
LGPSALKANNEKRKENEYASGKLARHHLPKHFSQLAFARQLTITIALATPLEAICCAAW